MTSDHLVHTLCYCPVLWSRNGEIASDPSNRIERPEYIVCQKTISCYWLMHWTWNFRIFRKCFLVEGKNKISLCQTVWSSSRRRHTADVLTIDGFEATLWSILMTAVSVAKKLNRRFQEKDRRLESVIIQQ